MLEWIKIFIHDLGPIKSSLDAGSAMPSFYYFLLSHFSSGNVKGIEVKRLSSFQSPFCTTIIKVIKEKWGQYFANDHFCTPLCSKRNGNLVIKKILEQKFAKSSVINLVPNAWFNDKNAIKKVRVELVFQYCLYNALWLCYKYYFKPADSCRFGWADVCQPNWS